ncbi:MAG: hypothetical protein ACOYXB_09825 [Bacteroidota bacterium]
MGRLTIKLLKGIFLLAFNLWVVGVYATTYYVSNSGNDAAAGTSKEAAWKTVAKVNSVKMNPGDHVLFEAGGVWRERLEADPGSSGEGNRVYYGRYGSGANPKLLGSEKETSWTAAGTANIWKSASTFENPRSGPMGMPAEISFLYNTNTKWGDFQNYDAGFAALTKEYDWTWEGNYIYVYSSEDPTTRYDSVEIPQRDLCIYAKNTESSYMEFDGIDMAFGRVQGFGLSYAEVPNQTDLTFRNLTVSYIGERNGSAAYGIEAFHSNFLVDSCTFISVGRRAISYNLYEDADYAGGNVLIKNVIVRNSRFYEGYHTSSLDLAMMPTPNCVGYRMEEIYFYNNIVDDTKAQIINNMANQIFTQEGGGYINRVYIYNNVFIRTPGRNILIEDGDSIFIWYNTIVGHNENIVSSPYSNVSLNHPNVIDYRNNILYDNLGNNNLQSHGVLVYYTPTIFSKKDYNLYYSCYPAIERNFNAHRANNNMDVGVSYWNTLNWADYLSDNPNFEHNSPVPQDPNFVDFVFNNFHVQEGSAALGAGTPIPMVGSDLGGRTRDPLHPSIGAYEFFGVVGTEEIKAPGNRTELLLKQNPARDYVVCEITGKNPVNTYHANIYSITGALVHVSPQIGSNDGVIMLPDHMVNGIYIVEVVLDNSERLTAKLCVSR